MRIDVTTGAEFDLINSCVDPQIAEEEAAILAERKLVSDKIREIQSLGPANPRDQFDYLTRTLAEKRQKMPNKNDSPSHWRDVMAEIATIEQQLEQTRPKAEAFDAEYASLQKQAAEINRRHAELNKLKLVP